MNFLRTLFRKQPDTTNPPQFTRWSQNGTMTSDDAARKGLQALLGLVLDEDPFSVPGFPSFHFDLGVSFYYSPGSEEGDFIGVYVYLYLMLAEAEEKEDIVNANFGGSGEFIYPRWGTPFMKLVMQPISDGTVHVFGNQIDTSRAAESMHGIGMMKQDDNIKRWRVLPVEVGTMPQDDSDGQLSHFLITYNAIDEKGNIMLHPRTLMAEHGRIRPYPIGWLEGWSAFCYFKAETAEGYLEETYTHFWPRQIPQRSLHYLKENGRLHWMVGSDNDWALYLSRSGLFSN